MILCDSLRAQLEGGVGSHGVKEKKKKSYEKKQLQKWGKELAIKLLISLYSMSILL